MEAPRILGLSQLLLLLGLPLLHCDPLYLLVAPRVLWVGSPENLMLQVHQDPEQPLVEPLEVHLAVWDFPLERKLLYDTLLTLSPKNKYMTLASVTIPESVVFPPRPGKQYVVLKATSKTFSLMKTILVAPHAGYIFIQTDKTIYTPEQLVQYRVFTVNHGLDPVMRPFTIDIKNPQGISVISQNLGEESGFFVGSFRLPELVSFGTWTIEARYQSGSQKPYSVSFDVKEYVLPSFEVQLTPNKTFFYVNDMTLGIDIEARYVFKKPVEGHALAIFGLKLDSGWITIQDSMQRVKISEGHGHASLSKATLTAEFQDLDDLLGGSIFVNVTVFSTAGEMVQAETSGVKIVRSPYNIRFTRTPRYFKPGMPFHFGVSVTNPDGSPAPRVHVQCEGSMVQTSDEGVGSLTLNTATNLERLSIRVETKDGQLQPQEQAFAELTIQAYKTQENSGNFLHIELNALETEVGQSLQLSLNTRHRNQDTKDRITHFTILLLSKGQIIRAHIEPKRTGGVVTSSMIPVSPELLPSFRILAYYILPGSSPELVADSIWIDVKDTCMGTLRIGLRDSADEGVFEPSVSVNLLLTGDPHALVGLVAVDRAVYALNSKHKLSQKKVWDVVETQDIGCTAGSGRDNLGVFTDAGVDLTTNVGMSTGASEDWRCPQSSSSSRKRRSLKILEKKKQKVNEFRIELERRCCEAGFREGPVGLSCEDRVPWVRHGPSCKAAFLQCCHHRAKLDQEAEAERLLLGTVDEDDDDDADMLFSEDSDLTVRTVFPESWLWRKVTLPRDPARGSSLAAMIISVPLPDSITTWQIMAVSLKKGKGVCISEPLEMTVRKTFFVDLKLPFSVVRNEQVQIQAILYNYMKRTVQVRVEFPYKKALCSKATKTRSFFQRVSVPPASSRVVLFTVMPVEPGNVDVEVTVQGFGVWDQVKKTLFVRVIESLKGHTQIENVSRRVFENMVPGTRPEVFVSVQGDILGEPILGALTPSEFHKLLNVPTGCPEQTLSSLAFLVILTQYLDATGQWGQVGVERRNQVMDNIVTGYARMLAHRNSNGTFHIHSESPGSTWLTSYVFRVFAMASKLMTKGGIDTDTLCSSAKWLITQRQEEDGSFQEKAPVIVKSMQGGYWGSEVKVSLTALVLIALKEGEIPCTSEELNVSASIQRAGAFLEKQLPSLKTVFSVAIASYALALADSPRANDRLNEFASPDKSHWKVGNDKKSLYTVEATAYALLQKLHLGRHEDIHAITKWLIGQRQLGGGFRSTQTTVVALEALSRYRQIIPVGGVSDIHVQIAAPARGFTVEWNIDQTNAYQLRSQKFSAQDDVIIKASGTGKGTLSVLTIYQKFPDSQKSSCHPYHLNVTLHPDGEHPPNLFLEKVSTYLKISPTGSQGYTGPQDATMTILEVSLLTGFSPDEGDLKQLTSNIEMYAFQYETKTSSSNSSVILYLEKLSNQMNIVLSFRIHQLLKTEFLQAVPVTIINYYEPEERCSAFYNLPGDAALMRRICHKDVCRCAEEKCPSLISNYNGIDQKELQITACRPGVDFVYKAHLEELEKLDTYVYYTMKILEVIKSGTDTGVLNKNKEFVSHIMCFHALGLKANETYLIMGQSSDLWKTRDDYSYALSMDTFIIKWPEISDVTFSEFRKELERFSEFLGVHGCEY